MKHSFRSPPAPNSRLKVPLFKGDLGGSQMYFYLSSCTPGPSKSRVFLPILTVSFQGKEPSHPQAFVLLGLKHREFCRYFSINCRGSRIRAVNVDKKQKILRPNTLPHPANSLARNRVFWKNPVSEIFMAIRCLLPTLQWEHLSFE